MARCCGRSLTTKEYPPDDLEAFRQKKSEHRGIGSHAAEIFAAIGNMPPTMRQLAPGAIADLAGAVLHVAVLPGRGGAQCIWSHRPELADLHARRGMGRASASGCTRCVCFAFSFFLPKLAKAVGRKHTHSLCLLCGALGLMSVAIIHDKNMLLLSMVGVGIAWASTLSMPYSVLAGSLPAEHTGVYMGIFNFFIVLPEIIASLGLRLGDEPLAEQQPAGGGDCRRRVHGAGSGADAASGRSRSRGDTGSGCRLPGDATLIAVRLASRGRAAH